MICMIRISLAFQITVREVVFLIHYKVLPYELKFRDPSPASIQAVSLAAKDSGDFASLSAVDLQVSAHFSIY